MKFTLDESCLSVGPGGAPQVNKVAVMRMAFGRDGLRLASGGFLDMLAAVQDAVERLSQRLLGREPSTNSLSNCRGFWNECLTMWVANNLSAEPRPPACFVRLDSNRDGSGFAGLFCGEMRAAIDPERHLASNPDFLVLAPRVRSLVRPEAVEWLDAARLDALLGQHELLAGRLRPGDVRGAISAKVSLRSDRRELLPFGGMRFKHAMEQAWRAGGRRAGQRIRREFVPEYHNIALQPLGNTLVLRQQTSALVKSFPSDSTTQVSNARELRAALIAIGRSCMGRAARRGIFVGSSKVEDMLDPR